MDIFINVCDPNKNFDEGTITQQKYLNRKPYGETHYCSELAEEVQPFYSNTVLITLNDDTSFIQVSYDEFCSWHNKEENIFDLLDDYWVLPGDLDVLRVSNLCEIDNYLSAFTIEKKIQKPGTFFDDGRREEASNTITIVAATWDTVFRFYVPYDEYCSWDNDRTEIVKLLKTKKVHLRSVMRAMITNGEVWKVKVCDKQHI